MKAFRFPEDFSLGVSSAATQVDGDCRNSNWYDWFLQGHIKDGSDPDITTEHRKFLREDTELMASLGIRDYRFGLEWARIEPEEGVYSEEEFARIREELTLLRERGIRPLVTLHHFSNPMWFERKGGFLCRDGVEIFLAMVQQVVEHIGDLAAEYVTVNEPNVYALSGYMIGEFPPGKKSLPLTLRLMDRLGECHRRAYTLIHTLRAMRGFSDTKVGFASHMRAFVPLNEKNPKHRAACRISRYLFQDKLNHDYLLGKDGKGLYADFLGLNYYARTSSSGLADGTRPGADVNDLGWEIYPAGIAQCCADLNDLAPALPIYITENGACDNGDGYRRRYVAEHLQALSESGLPVTRYYHWCFVDNLEWLEGFSARFGIVYLDTATQERRVKRSGEFYRQMIENRGVTPEMADEVSKEVYPHV